MTVAEKKKYASAIRKTLTEMTDEEIDMVRRIEGGKLDMDMSDNEAIKLYSNCATALELEDYYSYEGETEEIREESKKDLVIIESLIEKLQNAMYA